MRRIQIYVHFCHKLIEKDAKHLLQYLHISCFLLKH